MGYRDFRTHFVWRQTIHELRATWSPAADVYIHPTGWLVKFELAGVRTEDLQICIRGRRLVVSGMRRDVAIGAHHRAHAMEIAYDRFERSVELGETIEPAALEVEYRDGMLLVKVSHEPE